MYAYFIKNFQNLPYFLPNVLRVARFIAPNKRSRELFPCGRLRAEPSHKQYPSKATAGCATYRVSGIARITRIIETRRAPNERSRKLFPCGRLRAEPSQKQAPSKATVGCATYRVSGPTRTARRL